MADKSLKDLTGAVYKIAEDSPKIQKDVKDIREALCGSDGILGILISLNDRIDKIQKKDKFARLTNKVTNPNPTGKTLLRNTNSINRLLGKILDQIGKSSDDNAKAIVDGIKKYSKNGKSARLSAEDFRNTRRQRLTDDNYIRRNRRVDRGIDLSRSIDVINQLKTVKLRDFIFAKTKMKGIKDIMTRALRMFKMFKDKKEMEDTIGFVISSTDVMKKLSKISVISKPAQLGAKAIEKIFLGKKEKGGLLKLFRKISEHKKDIEKSKKSIKDILKACGSMLLTSIVLTGMAAVAIPAMVGALLMKGVIWLLTGTFVALSKISRPVRKGSRVMLMMSASVITFALGLGLMMKAVRNMKLKDVGMMMASIAGVGLTVAGIGLLAAPITLGSATLLLLGASLGIFGLAVTFWKNIDSKKAMGNIKEAVGGLRETFGLELGKHNEKKNALQRIGGGIMDIAMGLLNLGSTFFMMGSLLFAGVALGLLYHGLKRWDNFNGLKAANNIKVAVGALKDVFGIDGNNKEKGGKLGRLGGSFLDMGITIFQSGTALVQMGAITIATAMADIIRVTLIPWNRYNAKPAAANLKIAVDSLKDVFGFDKNMGKGFGKIDKLIGGALDMGITLMKAGGTLAQMGVITLATGMADIIRLQLKPWEQYDPTPAVENMGFAINSLSALFGLNENGRPGRLGRLMGSILEMGIDLMKGGGTLVKMGTIALATGMLGMIKENLIPWESYDSSKPVANIKTAINSLLDTFGISKMKEAEEAAQQGNFLQRTGKFIGNAIKSVGNLATSALDAANSMMEGGAAMAKISSLYAVTSILSSIKSSLEPWDSYNPTKAVTGISNAISTITGQIITVRKLDEDRKKSLFKYFLDSSKNIKSGLINIADGVKKSETIKSASIPFKNTVDTINSLDVTKASTMIELFKTFSTIKNNKPFDRFTKAVDSFSDSCDDLIKALNNFSDNYTMENTESGEAAIERAATIKGGVNITNTDALAEALAQAISSLPINVETNMPDVRLVVNNETGRRIVLSLDN